MEHTKSFPFNMAAISRVTFMILLPKPKIKKAFENWNERPKQKKIKPFRSTLPEGVATVVLAKYNIIL